MLTKNFTLLSKNMYTVVVFSEFLLINSYFLIQFFSCLCRDGTNKQTNRLTWIWFTKNGSIYGTIPKTKLPTTDFKTPTYSISKTMWTTDYHLLCTPTRFFPQIESRNQSNHHMYLSKAPAKIGTYKKTILPNFLP